MSRRRIIKKTNKTLMTGDVIRGYMRGLEEIHTFIILEDEPLEKDEKGDREHIPCLPVFNFTGMPVPQGEYSISLNKYKLPDHWFGKNKPTTWIRCNYKDCALAIDRNRKSIVGNILTEFPKLWKEVCEQLRYCEISPRLNDSCNCYYDEAFIIADPLRSSGQCNCLVQE